MIKPLSELIGLSLLGAHEGRPLGRIRGAIVDPTNGKVIAFTIGKDMVVATVDLIGSGAQFLVQNANAIVPKGEILRVVEIEKMGLRFLGALVRTEKGKWLGQVIDLLINIETMQLDKLDVAKKWLFLTREARLIPLSDIISVQKDAIIVKDEAESALKEKEPAVKRGFMAEPA